MMLLLLTILPLDLRHMPARHVFHAIDITPFFITRFIRYYLLLFLVLFSPRLFSLRLLIMPLCHAGVSCQLTLSPPVAT